MSTVQNYSVGTRVVSYDFPGNRDCYVIGTVVAVGRFEYEIEVEKRVLDAVFVDSLIGQIVRPPVNGLAGMFGVTSGVVQHG